MSVMCYSASKTVTASDHEQLILDHMDLVKSLVEGIRAKLPAHVELDDLINDGNLALIDAVMKYDASTGISFLNYAKHRIRGRVLDGLSKIGSASRGMRHHHRQIEEAKRRLTVELKRLPVESEVAEWLGMRLNRLRKINLNLWNSGITSTSIAANYRDNPKLLMDFPDSGDLHPDNMSQSKQRQDILLRAIDKLPVRHKQVMLLHFMNEMTLGEIGQRFGVNGSRVSRICQISCHRLADILQAQGIHSSLAL
jgi:RNA polymerase sigma factor for flagellar operon FliA